MPICYFVWKCNSFISKDVVTTHPSYYYPVGKIAKIAVWRSAFLLINNLIKKIQCHVVKNTLLQAAFSAISTTGICCVYSKSQFYNCLLNFVVKYVISGSCFFFYFKVRKNHTRKGEIIVTFHLNWSTKWNKDQRKNVHFSIKRS